MSVTETPPVAKARRRGGRPEQIALIDCRIEHLILEVKNASAITQLIDGLDRRLALLEEQQPTIGQAVAQRLLSQIEARANGQAPSGHNGRAAK